MMQPTTGRRERKKAATRQAIADAALRLFLQRGYDQVSVKDVADAADVATTTLFKHFPSKEALVFDEDQDREAGLVAAVRNRSAGQSVIDALRDHILQSWLPVAEAAQMADFTRLVDSTPPLRDYAARMWTRHAATLAHAIAEDLGTPADNLACVTLARFVLEVPSLARGRANPRHTVEQIFHTIEHGWTPPAPAPPRRRRTPNA
jgi:AcrR family transcriptional regulator